MAEGSAILGCKWRDSTPNIYRMGWRRFVNELLLVSPLLFLACITVQARTRTEGFSRVEYSQGMDRKIAAYIEPVRLLERALAHGRSEATGVRRVAEVWRKEAQSGALQPLLPEFPDDSTRDGIKGQIRSAADELGSQLQRQARLEIAAGKFWQAADLAMLSIEAIQPVKYSDLYAVGVISTRQNYSLELLDECIGNLDPQEKRQIAKRLEAIKRLERPLSYLVMVEQRALMSNTPEGSNDREYRRRFMLMLTLADCLDSDRTNHMLADLPSEMRKIGKSDQIDEVIPSLRFAWNARRNGNEDWRSIEAQLTTSP